MRVELFVGVTVLDCSKFSQGYIALYDITTSQHYSESASVSASL
jgi:hypothetical protein